MKTTATILTAAAACIGAIAPAHAEPGQILRGYTARYDAKRALYCIHTTVAASHTLPAEVGQKNCRTEQKWAEAGYTFSRRAERVEQVAMR